MAEILRIDHGGQRGDGVGFADGQGLFVPYTLPGETVEAGPVDEVFARLDADYTRELIAAARAFDAGLGSAA